MFAAARQRLHICLIRLSEKLPQVVRKAQQRKATITNLMADYGVQVWCPRSTQKHFVTTWATRSQQGFNHVYIFSMIPKEHDYPGGAQMCVISVT